MPRALWISDASCPTGFARVNENVIRRLPERWDVAMIGINATGDPYEWPCRVYPAMLGGDMFGYGRFVKVVKKERPDVILIHSDPWIIAQYLKVRDEALKSGELDSCPPVIGYMPIDAPGTRRANAMALNGLSLAIFYTEFAHAEARAAGFSGLGASIPLGIDPEIYSPMSQRECREKLFVKDGKPLLPLDSYIVGNVNRNQPRKRIDLTIAYFAKWVKECGRKDAYLYLHCAANDPFGWNIGHLSRYYGVLDRVLVAADMTPRDGVAENKMRVVYGSFDVQVSTTLGEGWGLTQHEGMACGVPQIVPEWSALAEWPRGAVRYVPVTSTLAHNGHDSNCIGGVADEREFIEALDELYSSADLRRELGQLGYERAREPQFSWDLIAAKWNAALNDVLGSTPALVAAA